MVTLNDYLYSGDTVLKILQRYTEDLRKDAKKNRNEIDLIHCNFLINTGNATARDIETLGETIIQRVKQTTSITLEWEIKRLGIQK